MTLRRTRSNLQLSEPPVEEWWEGGSSAGSADEGPGTSEYDCGILDLGTETPPAGSPNLVENNAFVAQWAQAGIAVPRVPVRRTSLRALGKERERAFLTKESVDRDCGICFEYAVMPCRTLCCGKIFCTEHLADWLHGPNAASQGTCPNCENPCSLESSTTLLTSSLLRDAPSLTRRRAHTVCASSTQHTKPKAKPGVYALSPLTAVQPRRNDTLPGSLNEGTSHSHALGQSTNLSSSSSATTVSSLESDEEPKRGKHSHTPSLVSSTSPSTTSTTPFAASWGAVSRLLSIITFLMFIYKLLS